MAGVNSDGKILGEIFALTRSILLSLPQTPLADKTFEKNMAALAAQLAAAIAAPEKFTDTAWSDTLLLLRLLSRRTSKNTELFHSWWTKVLAFEICDLQRLLAEAQEGEKNRRVLEAGKDSSDSVSAWGVVSNEVDARISTLLSEATAEYLGDPASASNLLELVERTILRPHETLVRQTSVAV